MRVLGIDPGLAHLGASVVDAELGRPPILLFCKAAGTEAGAEIEQRLVELVRFVLGVFTTWHPEIAGVEEQADVGWAKDLAGKMDHNSRRARDVSFVVAGALMAVGVPVYFVRAQTARCSLLGPGMGNAPKQAIKDRVVALQRGPGSDVRVSEHAADSVAAGAGGLRKHREALARARAFPSSVRR